MVNTKRLWIWAVAVLLLISVGINILLFAEIKFKHWRAEQTDQITRSYIAWADSAEQGDLEAATDAVRNFSLDINHVYGGHLGSIIERIKLREYQRASAAYLRLTGHLPEEKEFPWLQGRKPHNYK